MTTPQMDWLDDQRRKRAVSSDDIVRRMELMDVPPGSYDEETLYDAVAEIKRLRAQVAELLPWDEDIAIGERIRERAADFGIDLEALDADEQTFTKCCQGCDPSCDGPAACADRAWTEIERLRAAIDAVRQAVTDAGSHPEHHHEVRRRHEQEWPTLWRAIAGLREARRD